LKFVNDLPDSVTSSVRLFADDCLLYHTIKQEDNHQALQKDLKNLEEWANKWGMRFNAKSTKVQQDTKEGNHRQIDGRMR
jgi:hypothetical protein